MKQFFLILLSFSLLCATANASPVFTLGKKYRIASLDASGTGGLVVRSTPDGLKLVYEENTAAFGDSASWNVYEADGKYSFKNVATKKYIKLHLSESGTSLEMVVSGAYLDTTKFTLSLNRRGGLAYYGITSALAGYTTQAISKSSSGSEVAITEYNEYKNQLFGFYSDKDSMQVVDDNAEGGFYSYLDSFSIQGRNPVLVNVNNDYYYILTEAQFKEEVTKAIEFSFAAKTPSDAFLTINGQVVNSGDEFSFGDVMGGKKFRIVIMKGENELIEMNLYFTSHSIVQLYVNESEVNALDYTLGKILVNDPSSLAQSDTLDANFRHRGSYTIGYSKHSFAVKLVNPITSNGTVQYENLDKSFLGMREDNSWILDAMVMDPIRLRNRVSTDLWNDFSVKPEYFSKEPKAINGTRGKYVELFINDTYKGLYCLTETVNRKQLKMKKFKEGSSIGIPDTIRGLLYKAVNWTYPTLMKGINMSYNNGSETWDGWETQYPDASGLESLGYTDWKPLNDAVDFVANSTDEVFAEKVGRQFDLPEFRDYYLFIELLLATDNHAKNSYFSIYDKTQSKKISVTPWDLDGVFGRRWSGTKSIGYGYGTYPEQNFNTYVIKNENGQNNLYLRLMKNNVCGFNDSLKSRYAELRKEYFKPENLISRFVRYNDELTADGAANREVQRWITYTGTLEEYLTEISYLSTWINARVAYLDTQYGYVDTEEGLMVTALNLNVIPNPVSSLLIVSNLLPGETVTLHNQQGQLLWQQRAELDAMAIDFSGYAPGLYIVKAGNRTEKVIKQ